ncbi:MAG: BrnA antitoxin family protein [Bauldia sp.]
MKDRKKPPHISQEVWDDLDIPELTDEDFTRMRPAREVFPDIDKFPKPWARGPQKAPTKVQTTIRLDREVVEHFRRTGRGWQGRINETLRRAVERQQRAKS